MPVCLSTLLFTVTLSFPPSHLLFWNMVSFLMHWNLLSSSGCQVISNDLFHCDTSMLSYQFILMIYYFSVLYLHSFGKFVNLTFLNANTETVCLNTNAVFCEIFTGRQPWQSEKCSSISEIDSVPMFTVITVRGVVVKKNADGCFKPCVIQKNWT